MVDKPTKEDIKNTVAQTPGAQDELPPIGDIEPVGAEPQGEPRDIAGYEADGEEDPVFSAVNQRRAARGQSPIGGRGGRG